MTCSIMTLGIMDSIKTLIIKNTQHSNICLVSLFLTIMLSVVMLSVVMLSVVMLIVVVSL
jgi:hypothetical protein